MLDFGEDLYEKEQVLQVIQDLSVPCFDCRLGHCQTKGTNRGLIWRGNPQASIALVSIMPGPKEMVSGKPLTGPSGEESNKWFKTLNLDTNKDMLVINVVQCQPPAGDKKDKKDKGQREPLPEEFAICFPNRCLRVLRAMPNLEVIITLGWSAARCLLGQEPKEATHMGHWYTTSLLPGKAVYCLPHPAALLRDENESDSKGEGSMAKFLEKKYRVIKCLSRFRRSYLDSDKVVQLAKQEYPDHT